MPDYDPAALEERWQRAWAEAKAFEPRREEGKPKFFVIFAYPGISGYLHVGHMRGYSYCDAIARYHRSLGENVLFPAGFHASGIPAVSFARKVERKDPGTLETLRREGADAATVSKLTDPAFVVEYFRRVYEDRYWRRFGFSIDYSRLCATTDPGYRAFIAWQFRKLNENGLLVQKPHFAPFCPASGPVAVDPSETDVSQGGDADVLPFTVLKFRTPDGVVFPCATLRPETVFGVTNLWVNPTVNYVLADVQGERWLLSPEGVKKAAMLFEGGAREAGRVSGAELIGLLAAAPFTGTRVRVFPAPFVDPSVGTGVVMSVPGHAPYDLAALEALGRDPGGANPEQVAAARPVAIVEAGGPLEPGVTPAERALRAHKVASLEDRALLDAATDEVYALEFHEGRMLENTGAFAGLSCREARERAVREATDSGEGAPFPAFSKAVVCRCGEQVLIKRIPDQWFIKYSDEALTEASARHAATMLITPPEYARDLPGTLRWFADRACIRQGAWLGTPFPLDERWVIEPISDSTLYPAFYVVSPYVNDGRIRAQDLSDPFFDYVFLGRGDPGRVPGIPAEVVEACRRDFLYWYPLDLNLGGKEHKTVHFPAFVKTHVGLLEPAHWPRGIFVNFWVTQSAGEKLSKSKGGAQPLGELTAAFGVDALRLYYAHAAAPWLDIEWDPDAVIDYRLRLARIYEAVQAIAAGDLGLLGARAELPASASLDRWLLSALRRRVEQAAEGWRSLDLRSVATPVYFGMLADLRWYARRGGHSASALRTFAGAWAALMGPITPHLAEELHAALGGRGLVLDAPLPVPGSLAGDAAADAVEAYLETVLEDTQRIRAIAESFAAQAQAVAALEGAAGKRVRGELVGSAAPFAVPPRCERDATVGGERVSLLFSGGPTRVAVVVQARRSASLEDVDRLGRIAAAGSADAGWVVALGGAPLPVREAARTKGVLLTGPAEFELLAAEAGAALARPVPKRIAVVAPEPWKAAAAARAFKDAQAHDKPDAGRLLKALAGEPAFKPHMKAASKVVAEAAKEAGAMRPKERKERLDALESLDEYSVLRESAPFLEAELGCAVEVLSAENPESRSERLRGKADAAQPLRPAIAIEY